MIQSDAATGPSTTPLDPEAGTPPRVVPRQGGPNGPRPGRRSDGISGAPDVPVAGPRFETLWATVIYTVVTLALGFPALAGRFLVNENSDQYIAGYAFRELATASVRAGQGIPLWNPYLFGGMPYVAAMHGDTFYPTAWLRVLVGTDVGMTWGFIVHVILAGVFAFLFLRRAVGVSWFPALVGGLAYMIGGNVAGLVSPGHDGKLFLAALLPLVLFFTHRGVRDGKAWAWGALVLSLIAAILTPHPQLFQYLLLITGAYTLFLAFTAPPGGTVLPRGTALARIGAVLAAVGAGIVGGAIQFWPVLEYTPWSPRAGGKGWEHAISYSMPVEELLNTYLPQFSGILGNYWGRNGIHLHSEYIGTAVLVLAGLAFGTRGRARRQMWFWTGAFVVTLLWALGGNTPFYSIVYALVPGTKFFRAPSTMLYVVSFCTAVLAAIGTERLLAEGVRPRYVVGWLAFAAVVAALATGGMLTNVALGLVVAPELAARVEQNAGALTFGAWRSLAVVAATVSVGLLVHRRRVAPAAAGWALAAVVAVDLWSVLRNYWMFSAPAAALYASDPTIEYLKTQTDSGRVVPIAVQELVPGERDPYFGGGDGRADGLMAHQVRSVVGYHGNELGNFLRLSGWSEGDIRGDWPRQLGNPNFWRLLNIRFLYTNGAEPPIPGARLVAGPARNVAGNMVYLYRLPGDNPPAWVTPLAVKAADDNVLATVLDPRFDVGRVALFDTAAAVPTQPVPAQLPAPLDLRVRVNARQPGHITFALDRPAPAGATLVVSENYYPGWTARVDGRPVQVGRADLTLIGVPLAAGARTVELDFRSPRYERGRAITIAVLAASVLLVAGGVLVERRRTRAAEVAPVG